MKDEDFAKFLQQAVEQIRNQQDKILEDFAKAYVASISLESPRSIAWIITHLVLNQQSTETGYKFWYSLKDEE